MNFLTNLDYLGTQPTLYINGRTSYKTLLGAIISMVYLIILITGISYFFSLLISKETFTISNSDEFNPNMYTNWKDLELSIILVNNSGIPYSEQHRIYGVVAMWLKWEEYIKPDNSSGSRINMLPLNLEKCNLTKHFEDESLWRTVGYLNQSFCTDSQQNINLSKTNGATNFSFVNLWVHRCRNTTTKRDCYPEEKIEEELINANLAIRFKTFYFDHKKTDNIGMPYIFRDILLASSSIYRKLKYTMKEVEYFNEDGFIIPGSYPKNYKTFHNYRESTANQLDSSVPGSFLEISFENHILKQVVKKDYYKFQNMIADIGGLLKATLTILTLFSNYFSERMYFKNIIDVNMNSMQEKNTKSNNVPIRIPKLNIFTNRNHGNSQLNLIKFKADSQQNLSNLKNTPYEINNLSNLTKLNLVSQQKISKTDSKNFELNFYDLITPIWCIRNGLSKSKNLSMYYRYKKYIIEHLDVKNIVKKLNNLDKLILILTGNENKLILENCINPYSFDPKKLENLSEFNEVKTQILSHISDYILNSYFVEKNTML